MLTETAFKELKESVTIDQHIKILNKDIKLLKVPSGNSIVEKYNSSLKKKISKGVHQQV